MSVMKASACRSNISLTCSSNESGTPSGRGGQGARLAAGVVLLDPLNAPLDLADVVQIGVQAAAVAGAEVLLQAR